MVNWGILSAGKISHDFVAAMTLIPDPDQTIVAIAANDINRAKQFASEFNIPTAFDSYEKLAKHPGIDIVYVGVINSLHYETVLMLLNNNKNVLCEKPMSLSLKQTEEMIKLAQQKKLFLMEGLWSRFFPIYEKLRNILKEGRIGEVRQVLVNFGLVISSIPRISEIELGGGGILDLGVYTIQFITLIFGPKVPVSIEAFGAMNKHGLDENVTCTMKFSEKQFATMTISTTFMLPSSAFISGTKGYIEIPVNFSKPTKMIVNGDKVYEIELPKSDYPFTTPNGAGLSYEAQHVNMCIKKGLTESPLVTHKDSLVIAEIQRSIIEKIGAFQF